MLELRQRPLPTVPASGDHAYETEVLGSTSSADAESASPQSSGDGQVKTQKSREPPSVTQAQATLPSNGRASFSTMHSVCFLQRS